jgi:hypothetical protein
MAAEEDFGEWLMLNKQTVLSAASSVTATH